MKLCALSILQPRTAELERRMRERGDAMKIIKDKMNTVEDEVFSEFCVQIGVANIRYNFVKKNILIHSSFESSTMINHCHVVQ